MDDLSERDLSQIPDEELTPAERRELRRRFDDLFAQVRDHYSRPKGGGRGTRDQVSSEPAEAPAAHVPVQVRAWDPAASRRRH